MARLNRSTAVLKRVTAIRNDDFQDLQPSNGLRKGAVVLLGNVSATLRKRMRTLLADEETLCGGFETLKDLTASRN
jgi:hypothetical protein